MTRLERRVHRLIEKAIVEHGYVLRPGFLQPAPWLNRQEHVCCAVGAIAVATGALYGDADEVSDHTKIPRRFLWDMSHGFEHPSLSRDTPGARLGADIRERYVVNG